MKVKEIERTANVAWSPAVHHPILMATATAAQQLDATFNTAATLEIFDLNLEEPGHKMMLKGCIPLEYRFHKTAWGAFGMSGGDSASGMIVGGADGGNLLLYDPAKLMKGEDALVCQKAKHTGTVRAVDFNPFQTNLLASGASESEIFIWDLNNPSAPMTPGAKSQPADDVSCVSWNRQVQHILASTFATRCIVWDLRKNEPIIKVNDSTSNLRCKVIAWHPEVATQLCLASEDEHSPLIQLWDLRFATSPLKCLEKHQRGVLSLAWCQQDPDLLLSCGKDNRILCWNPSSNVAGGEIVCELPVGNQWNFDVAWCPRNPGVISSASFDGHVTVYSLMGGSEQQAMSSKQISDSFPGSDMYQEPVLEPRHVDMTYVLKKPPNWIRRPVGASFGFGGKLVTFENVTTSSQRPSNVNYHVYISQVFTEPQLVERSRELESVLKSSQFSEFCQKKVDVSVDEPDKQIWKFLEASFATNPSVEYLKLLDYDPQNNLDTLDGNNVATNQGLLVHPSAELSNNVAANNSEDGFFDNKKDSDIFDNLSKGQVVTRQDVTIPTSEDVNGNISRALLVGNLEKAVDLCLENDLLADAILLAMTSGEELLRKTRLKYFSAVDSDLSNVIAAVVNRDWSQIIRSCDIENWKEALVGAITYGGAEFNQLCESLGSRLENERQGEYKKQALLCYICSGNVEKLTDCYVKCYADTLSPYALQDFVEVAVVLSSNVHKIRHQSADLSKGLLGKKLCQYAELLASQGSLNAALSYLGGNTEGEMVELFHRLSIAAGTHPATPSQAPTESRRLSHEGARQPDFTRNAFSPGVQSGKRVASSGFGVNNYKEPAHQQLGDPMSGFPAAPKPQPVPGNVGNVPMPGRQTHTDPSNIYARGGHLSQRYPAQAQQDQNMYAQPAYATPSFPQQNVNKPPAYPSVQSNFPPRTGANQWEGENAHGHYPTPQNLHYNYQQPTGPAGGPVMHAPMINTPHVEQPGWNDPPQLKTQQKVKSELEYMAPITQPLFVPAGLGSTTAPSPGPAPVPGGPVPNIYEHQHFEAMPASVPQQQPDYMYRDASQETMNRGQERAFRPDTVAPAPAQVAEVRKGTIPEEHRVLQEIFDDLRSRCSASNPNPQIKRKLDDVAKRLETLYDKLSNNELSPNIVHGLHRIAQVIGQDDYETALSVHAQLVSMGSFSEIGAFMPGLKVLLQTARHLGVTGFAR